MSVFTPFTGLPGISAEKIARHRTVAANGYLDYLPGGKILDATKTRDVWAPDGDTTRLQAGLLLGKVTATGRYANCFFGVLQGAVSATGTSVTLTAAQAVELVRRVGSTGTLRFVGPPAAAGTVATFTETYSAVNTTTGVVTVSALDADLIAGALVAANDGSYLPLSFLPDGWETPLPDSGDLPLPFFPIGGMVDDANLLPWPSDTSLRQWVRDQLNAAGKFEFAGKF